jgi:YegS/Rv2252/BmrU family lipid kinase
MKKRILFIINPVAGVKSKHTIPDKIGRFLDTTRFDYEIIYTQGRGHATELAAQAARDGFDIVSVAGGDGSVNEVATGLIGTQTALAIMPMGSGNGLARHLGYKTNPKSTLQIINAFEIVDIDVCKVNNRYFFSLIGLGFDAFVAKLFNREETRGFFTYAYTTLRSLNAYQPYEYTIDADGAQVSGRAFMINVCNSNQFGYNVKIAPEADLSDGLLNVIVMHEFPKWKAIFLFLRVVFGNHLKSRYFQRMKASSVSITAPGRAYLQIDGETVHKAKEFNVSLEHKKLRVLINPDNY